MKLDPTTSGGVAQPAETLLQATSGDASRTESRQQHARIEELTNTYTAIFERAGDWYIAYCPEIPGANGQGQTKHETRESLAAAIALILQDRREDALRGLPDDAERETVTVA